MSILKNVFVIFKILFYIVCKEKIILQIFNRYKTTLNDLEIHGEEFYFVTGKNACYREVKRLFTNIFRSSYVIDNVLEKSLVLDVTCLL